MYKCVSFIDKLERKSGFQNSGSELRDVYEYKDVDGKQTLVKSGTVNGQEEIESYAKSCDIRNILARFANGEVDLLNTAGGFYADVRNMPKTYAEYFERVNEAKKIFDDLPADIRAKFDNNAEKFFMEFGTQSFADKVAVVEPVPDPAGKELDNAE